MPRQAVISLILGKRNSGKSYYTINRVINKYNGKVLVVDTIDHEKYRQWQILQNENQVKAWRSGVKRWITNDLKIKDDMLMLNQHLSNCLIVFEDATKYFRTNSPKPLFNLLYDSKQKSIDVILMYHGFKKILPEILDNANYVTMFKMEEQIEKYEHKIPRFEILAKAYSDIKASEKPFINKTIQIN